MIDPRGSEGGLKIGFRKDICRIKSVTLSGACVGAIRYLLANAKHYPDDFLFKSKKDPVLLAPTIHNLVKGWRKAIKLKGKYGFHTLRKTSGGINTVCRSR